MRGARPEREVEATIERAGVLREGERVLVACSGGPDSVALAAALHSVAPRIGAEVCMAHVNHGVRSSAWQDECIVLQLAAVLGMPLRIAALQSRTDDEARLRLARYRALAKAAKTMHCSVIATAHHAEDQTETVFLALLRGSGLAGLSGMPARRALEPGLDLARPLLGVAPEMLRAYCHARALPYAVDPTNSDAGRRRNAVREALANLRPLFPALDRAVARAAEVIAEEQRGSPRAGLRRSVRERFAADHDLRDLDFAHVEAAVRALESGRSGTYFMKPGIGLRVEGGSIAGIITTE
ncbi:MAG TPA: tRNA lysidine(34) synthetase TilS [Candidatus Cybelea sp.]|jgi:tRNA(Ile)-lysidine synthase|nr:tRNA lysidine(34) synthetase TilS [Candidatus Cybelea sp.]